ncbi:MAG: adenylate/guanylate cyclase domain-containing protein [Candidatus Nitrosotenuis sp.]
MAKILGLLEEKGKNKDWLLEELRRLKTKPMVSTTANSYEILRCCPAKTLRKVHELLVDDHLRIEEIKAQTRTLHWFFTDIVGSSDPKIPVKSQIRKINVLQNYLSNSDVFKKHKKTAVVLPTGDGMSIGFTDSLETPLRLAIQLHQFLNRYNKSKPRNDKIYVRIGINTGPVYFIKDMKGNNTVWGPGIILSRRLMDLCGPNQIFASQKVGDDVSSLTHEYKAMSHPIGNYVVKHGEQHLIYNIYGKNFGNKIAPKKGKVLEKPKEDIFAHPVRFEFNSVEVKLDVLDKSMMTHHTWIWDVKNTANEPLSQVYYDIGGDVPKDFADLNVSIKDENGNKLEIISLDVNKPHEKKFNVKLATPIRKNQKGKLILEYDWEEPERVFEYMFSARCKKFKYSFTIPKNIPIKNMILEVVPGLEVMKKRVEPPPAITYTNNKTMIVWETKGKQIINRLSAYEFKW